MNLRSTMVILTSVFTVSIVLNLEPTNSLAIDSPLLADSEEENADFLALSDSYQRTEFRVNASELQCHGEECGNVAHALLSIAQRFIEPHVVLYSFRDNGKLQRHTRANDDFQPTRDVSFLNATGRSRTNPSASDFYSAYFANNQVPNLSRQRGATLRTPAEADTYDSTTGEVRRSKYSQANLLALADDSYAGGGTYSGPAYETTAYDSYGGGGGYGGGGYGGGGYGGYGGYGGQQCCGKKDSLLPLLVVGALGLLAFYLYLQSTTTAAGRRRRNADGSFSDELEDEEVMLDGSTWLSLIHELWEQDGVVDDPSCAQHTLCRMNYLAMSAPGQAGWAVSLSSMPLSYLLHNRHNGGFSLYMDAALLGRTGANCTSLFSSCPRLH